MLAGLKTLEDVDERVRKLFGFKDAEWTLVEDLFRYTLPDFQGNETSPGRQPTERTPGIAHQPTKAEPQLAAYCRCFTRVLKAGFGQDKPVCATIFQDDARSPLPVRLVGIHLNWPRDEPIVVEPIDSAVLCDLLMELNERWLKTGDQNRGGIFYQRVAMVYAELEHQKRLIPTVYIVKPDRIRYWTRSPRCAMRMKWPPTSNSGGSRRGPPAEGENDAFHLPRTSLARFARISGNRTRWCEDQSRLLLDLVWQGFDLLAGA